MDQTQAFTAELAAGPTWVAVWVAFMGLVLVLSIPFSVKRVEARWALFVMLVSAPAMIVLYSLVGYVRLLGLVHVVIWTPFVWWLWTRRKTWRVKETLGGKWILLLFLTMIVSLVLDYADVLRWLAGDRS